MPPDLSDFADTLQGNAPFGIGLALIAAVLLAFGTQFQNRGVSIVERRSGNEATTGLSLTQLRALLTRPSWVLGSVLLGIAIVLQLTSLTLAPITVVQPLGAIALVITSIANARITGVPLDRVSWRAIVVCVLGVALFVAIAALVTKKHPIREQQLSVVLIILTVVLAVFIGLFILMKRRNPRPIFYVIGAGVLFGFVVTLANVVIGRVQTILLTSFTLGAADILTLLCLVGLVAAALLGTYFVQTAHSSNPPDLVVAGLTVIDPLVAVAIGIVVLGEAASAPPWAFIAFIVAGAAAVWGVVSLSRHHPQSFSNAAITAAPARSDDDL